MRIVVDSWTRFDSNERSPSELKKMNGLLKWLNEHLSRGKRVGLVTKQYFGAKTP